MGETGSRYPYGSVLVGTVLGTIFLCCNLTLAQCGLVGGGRVPQPIPSPVQVAVTGSAAVSADGQTIVYGDPNRFCQRTTVNVDETETEVRLKVYLQQAELAGCWSWRNASQTGAVLARPVGSRAIVDALTGKPIPWFDRRKALHPVPPLTGWQIQTGSYVGDVAVAMPDFGGPGSATFATRYIGLDSRGRLSPDQQLWIIQCEQCTWTPPAGTAISAVTVRGVTGQAAPGIIVWPENGQIMAVRWDNFQHPAPATERLVAITETLYQEAK